MDRKSPLPSKATTIVLEFDNAPLSAPRPAVPARHDVSQFHRLATLNDASESVIRLTHDLWTGRKQDAGCRDNSTSRISPDVERFLRSVAGEKGMPAENKQGTEQE